MLQNNHEIHLKLHLFPVMQHSDEVDFDKLSEQSPMCMSDEDVCQLVINLMQGVL